MKTLKSVRVAFCVIAFVATAVPSAFAELADLTWDQLLQMTGPEGDGTRYMRNADGSLHRAEARYGGDLVVAVTECRQGFRVTVGNELAVTDFASRPWFTAEEREGLTQLYGDYVAGKPGSKLFKLIGRFRVAIEEDPDLRVKNSFVLISEKSLNAVLDTKKAALPATFTVDQAELLARNSTWLLLGNVTNLSDEAAEALAEHRGGITLDGLTSLSESAARSLARSSGPLYLNGLTSLSDEAAKALAEHKGNLALDGLTTLSDNAARAFAGHQGCLYLKSVTAVSVEAARALAEHEDSVSLNGIVELSDEAAAALAKSKGPRYLRGVKTLSDGAREALSKGKEIFVGSL